MLNLGQFEIYIINQIMANFPLGYAETIQVIKTMKDQNLISRNIVSEAEANEFMANEIKSYLLPKGFFRF